MRLNMGLCKSDSINLAYIKENPYIQPFYSVELSLKLI